MALRARGAGRAPLTRARLLAGLACGLVFGATACSGRGCRASDEESSEPAPKPKPKKAALVADCERYAQTFCELYERCDHRNYEWAYDDAKRCREATTTYCAYELRAPGSGDTPKAINDCAEAFTKTSCDDWGTHNTPAACHPPGTRKVGEPCQISAQCVDYYCKLDGPNESCGKCAKLPAEGDLCPGYYCQIGSLCISGRCQKPKKEGDTCATDVECAASLVCFKEKRWAYTGVCKKPVATGAACLDPLRAYDDELEVDEDDDAPKLIARPSSTIGTIGPIGLGALDAGKSDAKSDVGPAAEAGDASNAGDAGDASVDARPPRPSSDCNRRQGDTCVAGTCTAEKRLSSGDRCTLGAVCKSGNCELGKCEARRKNGEKCEKSTTTNPCRFPAKCIDGSCRVLDGFECDAPPKTGPSSLLPFR
jgi:hypothetical protein